MRALLGCMLFLAACSGAAGPAPAPAPPLPSPPSTQQEPLRLEEVVRFPPDVATPGPQVRAVLDTIAAKLRSQPLVRVEIAGHADETELETVAYARANLVASSLAARGVPRARVVVETYGHRRPLAPSDTDDGRAKNRRVDFRVLED